MKASRYNEPAPELAPRLTVVTLDGIRVGLTDEEIERIVTSLPVRVSGIERAT